MKDYSEHLRKRRRSEWAAARDEIMFVIPSGFITLYRPKLIQLDVRGCDDDPHPALAEQLWCARHFVVCGVGGLDLLVILFYWLRWISPLVASRRDFREPEIDDFYARRSVRAGRQEEVRGLDIPMDEFAGVSFSDGVARLEQIHDGFLDGLSRLAKII